MKALWQRLGKYQPWVIGLCALIALALFYGSAAPQSSVSAEEKRIATVLSAIEGAGSVEVALYYEESAGTFGETASRKPCGALIVAEGAQDLKVRLTLVRAVRTLLGLPETAVDVFAMKEATR